MTTRSPTSILRLWFGISEQVGPKAYALTGFTLALLKYGVEALVVWASTGAFFTPWNFLNPVVSLRTKILQPAPDWIAWALLAWTLPFLWIAISMSVRRAADAGRSPWLGLVILVPLVNLIFMLTMCLVPSQQGDTWRPYGAPQADNAGAMRAVIGIGISLIVGGVMVVTSVYLFSTYGSSLFLGTPLLMGATAAHYYNRPFSHSYSASMGIGIAAVFYGGLMLLLFALEGVICLLMAAPLLLPLGAVGGLMGKAIADSSRRPHRGLMAAVAMLPILAGAESLFSPTTEYEVMSAVDIHAPPEKVWDNVVSFPDLPEPTALLFRLGVACPERARIVGSGEGATRYCEFTTGTFVEPITAWEAPTRLAFDVTDQPAPMFELSPYRHVHPPHLHGYLRSNRGEFRLIRLPNGDTRLEGRTWYEFEMFPQWYWTLWSDQIIHQIHERVLLHIKRISET